MTLAAKLQGWFLSWALRADPPEPTPIRLVQKRIYVLPTRAGLLFAASLLPMFLAAVNYNLALGHALVFLLAGLGIVAILHAFRNLIGLSIDVGRAPPVFAGDIARFALVLHNPRDEERRLIGLTLPGGEEETIDVPARGATEAQLGVPATHRGWLRVPRVTLQTRYPLGLARAWSYAAPELRCLVYPRPAENAPPLPAAGAFEGSRVQLAHGSEDFAGLRAHQPADSPRHVAWKVAARLEAGPLLTKQFAGAAGEALWVDWDLAPPELGVEARLSTLVRWVLDSAAGGLVWGLRLPGCTLPPASGEAHLHACLKALALHEAR